ncbi:MAG TPA: RNA-binding protein [Rhodothermales bacterium]|nr:RNA-binding protein [Rhodothermales bacterium]
MKNIFVGNLPFRATEEEVRQLFTQYGTVHSVNLISDRETGRPRGFGFVEMDTDAAEAAIRALDGTEFGGRNLQVNEARDKRGGGQRREGGFERRGGGGGDFGRREGQGGYDRGDRGSRYSR